MKLLIAGGTGFLGTKVIRYLSSLGHRVTVLTRTAGRYTPSEAVSYAAWDGTKAEPVMKELPGVSAVINLAGASIAGGRWTPERKKLLWSSRIESTSAIVRAMESAVSPPVLINASAVGFYGNRADEQLSESSAAGSGFLAGLVQAWEAEALRYTSNRAAMLRFGIVLGEGGALKQMALPFKLFAGGPVGSGTQWLPWIHVDDVSRVVRYAIDSEQYRGPINVVSPEAVTNREFSRQLGRVLHRPSWIPVPEGALRIVLGEMADMLLGSQRVVPEKLVRYSFQFKYSSLTDALRASLLP
jgi:uncharacterized protein (TIGR01777 family)